jgi:hypothetical protein
MEGIRRWSSLPSVGSRSPGTVQYREEWWFVDVTNDDGSSWKRERPLLFLRIKTWEWRGLTNSIDRGTPQSKLCGHIDPLPQRMFDTTVLTAPFSGVRTSVVEALHVECPVVAAHIVVVVVVVNSSHRTYQFLPPKPEKWQQSFDELLRLYSVAVVPVTPRDAFYRPKFDWFCYG